MDPGSGHDYDGCGSGQDFRFFISLMNILTISSLSINSINYKILCHYESMTCILICILIVILKEWISKINFEHDSRIYGAGYAVDILSSSGQHFFKISGRVKYLASRIQKKSPMDNSDSYPWNPWNHWNINSDFPPIHQRKKSK